MKLPLLVSLATLSIAVPDRADAAVTISTQETIGFAGVGLILQTNRGNVETSVGSPTFNVTTTTVVNDAGTTIREYGQVAAFTSNVSLGVTFEWYTSIQNPFPFPPTQVFNSANVLGTITVDVPAFAFDTGERPLFYTGSAYAYESAPTQTVSASAQFTYSITTGEQTYTGGTTVPLTFAFNPVTRTIIPDGYPSTIAMKPKLGFTADFETPFTPLNSGTTANNFQFHWGAVPEPSIAALFGFASCLFLKRRRR